MASTSKFHKYSFFTPLPVTVIVSAVYIALVTGLLVVHLVVPSAPKSPTPFAGVNTTEAWLDLQELTNGYRPYNSHRNDEVRDFLLRRIDSILTSNGVGYSTESLRAHAPLQSTGEPRPQGKRETFDSFSAPTKHSSATNAVVIFDDMLSNATFSTAPFTSVKEVEPGLSVYFEGTNIMVYIRGTEDEDGEWWRKKKSRSPNSKGGVLVNAHYDSVSTGFGATDDGVGVISVLQLIRYFTTSGNTPKRGIVALLNNGEEDFLNGARAFTQHPISQFAHTFLNLEGAGAGGRATLFRSTDTEVTRFYKKSKHPFGTVISGDGFNHGFIRSQTDYVVFEDILGLRGLDVAFMEPRARYHTDHDDTRHTSIDSLWHMLSSSITTVKGLSSDTSSTFDSDSSPSRGKVNNGKGTNGVWFDLFGRTLALFQLHTIFAISVTLLVVAPLMLLTVSVILRQYDKMYLFSSTTTFQLVSVTLHGWRGVFRFPAAFIVASAIVVGLAFLVTKANPYIIYSSEYSVWTMMLSAWFVFAWLIFRGADFTRPSALHRVYCHLWLFVLGWVALVVVTVSEKQKKIAGLYFMVFYFCCIFLATLISVLELFALPTKADYAIQRDDHVVVPRRRAASGSQSSARLLVPSADERAEVGDPHPADEDEDANERTPLFRHPGRTTFANYPRSHDADAENEEESADGNENVYGEEQAWSASLPQWTWLLQFLVLAVIPLIFVGQVSLLIISALKQTPADGSPVLMIYLLVAIFSILLLSPLTPFLHRFTYHIPIFLFLVALGTFIYNLTAFPFSPNNRLKIFFLQSVDLDSGINSVSLTGLDPYIRDIASSIPSAAGKPMTCMPDTTRKGLTSCSWSGLAPRVVQGDKSSIPHVPPEIDYPTWLDYTVSSPLPPPPSGDNNTRTARIYLNARDTRACKLTFSPPISSLHVLGSAARDPYDRFSAVPSAGSKEVRLWRREWGMPWTVDFAWDGVDDDDDVEENAGGMDGTIVCLWSDDNDVGTIPALDEVRRFAPVWVAVSKYADGLVEGAKTFLV
ncbi:MAG: hypothetical protein M1819_003845 [Sarea resinae]|nr:MAG: hypothetical protein M1819_003845 [Sarea resinae]